MQNRGITKVEIDQFYLGLSDKDIEVDKIESEPCLEPMHAAYDRSLEISKERLHIYWDHILGTGQFGSVHMAVLKTQTPKEVALKTTKTGCPTNALRGLLSEIKILTHLGEHPNIVSICGAYTSELQKGKVYVALELCSKGSLKRYLNNLNAKSYESESLSDSCISETLLRWSCEISAGMEYIGQKGVIHGDLASRNVLLTHDGTAKIADFGLSKRLYDYTKYVKKRQELLPWKWMAIESLKLGQFSYQSDVWSYGITLWEIFSLGAAPYPGYEFNARFIESLENGSATMKRPSKATGETYQIMLDCWNIQPELRPTFTTLKTRIMQIFNEAYYEIMS